MTAYNAVETNYISYYALYLKSKTEDGLSEDDLASLADLAALCPYTNGAVVYQARALYNNMSDAHLNYNDNCLYTAGEGGKLYTQIKDKSQVILKSKLYPNPNDGNFRIRFTSILQKEKVEITIFNTTGGVVVKENKNVDVTNEIYFKNNLLNGTYLIKVNLPDGTYDLHRLIISK